MDYILSLVLFTPLIGFVVLLLIPSSNTRAIKLWANIASFAGFLVTLPLLFSFDPGKDFQFVEKADWIPSIGASYHLGIDGISLLLVVMTGLIGLYLYYSTDWAVFGQLLKEAQPAWVLVAVVSLLMTFLTEFTSNVATVNAVLPIVAAASVALHVDPRLLMIPATIAASCGFMMPIGTPPNAIVFSTGRIRAGQMAGYGLVLNLLGAVLLTLATMGLMVPQLGIKL